MTTIDGLRTLVLEARGGRRAAIAFVAGALSVLAMAPFHIWPVLLVTLPTLVWLIDGSRNAASTPGTDAALSPAQARRDRLNRLLSAASAGWWFGFGYFLLGLFWIGEAFLVEAEKYAFLIPFAVTLLPAGLASFFAAASAAAAMAWQPGFTRVLVLAVALGASEWLRGHILTGLPWNTLGYALTYPLPLMQWASVLGAYGLTPWVVLILALPLVAAGDTRAGADRRKATWRALAVAGLPLVAAALYGAATLEKPQAPSVDGVRLRIVQPSVPQRDKWRPENQASIFRDHLDLSRTNELGRVDDMAGITHVIWPEAAMPFLPLEQPEAMAGIGELLPEGTQLISGSLRLARGIDGAKAEGATLAEGRPLPIRRVFNSLIVFSETGVPAGIYDKTHLVPFGEYLPFQRFWRYFGLGGLAETRGGLSAGEEPRPLLAVAGLPAVAPLICYEAIFPGAVVQTPERPGLLLSVTNDGWFGNTTGPRQHFHQARVRAVEEGLPLVRAANNGISAVIDAEGRVTNRLDLDVRGVIDADLPGARPRTVYARLGDLMLAVTLAAFAFAAWWLGRPRNRDI